MEEDLEGYTQNQEELTLKSVGKKMWCFIFYDDFKSIL